MVAKVSEVYGMGRYFTYLEDLLRKTNPASGGKNTLYWREKLFSSIFLPIIIVGFFLYIPSIILCLQLARYEMAVVDTLAYFTVITITIFRSIPFKIRAMIGVMAFYFLGFVLLFLEGPVGFGQIWVFAFPVLTGLFMGTRPSLYALLLNAVAFFLIGILIQYHLIHWPLSPGLTVALWAVDSVNFLFTNTIVTIALVLLFQGLQKSLRKEKAIAGKLNHERRLLLEANTRLKKEIHKHALAERDKIKLEKQLQEAQKMESIGTLVGGIAHDFNDFNNILCPIIGFTELTLSMVPENSLAQKNLKEIYIAASRARDLVQQILRFSRMETLGFQPIRIQEIIQELVGFLRASIPTTIDIYQEIDDHCGPISGDPAQIHQLILNLCTNAFQAMEETGGRLELILRTDDRLTDNALKLSNLPNYQYVVLTIGDTGPGIRPEIRDRIFDPYFTTKEQGHGTGLGLYIAHGIVKSHGGEIRLHSAPGEGARFDIYLPLTEETARIEEPPSEDLLDTGAERILVVDDEQSILKMAEQMLGRAGYSVETCPNSQTALELFRFNLHQYDLVVTDLTMPHMTGLELAKKMKELRADTAIILCTGFSERISREEVKTAGIDGLIMKPVARRDLTRMIRDILDNREMSFPRAKEKAAG